jgi:hypothetical protein
MVTVKTVARSARESKTSGKTFLQPARDAYEGADSRVCMRNDFRVRRWNRAVKFHPRRGGM